MISPSVIDLNPIGLKYYPFMISLNCDGSCNVFDDLCTEICVPSETEKLNFKAFNLITKLNEVKIWVKHIWSDCNCPFNSLTCKEIIALFTLFCW